VAQLVVLDLDRGDRAAVAVAAVGLDGGGLALRQRRESVAADTAERLAQLGSVDAV
jgi:hypothetical protein